VKRAIEKLKAEMKQAKEPKAKPISILEPTSKDEIEVFRMGSLYGTLMTVNAVFSVAAVRKNNICKTHLLQFPVHAWGYSLGVDPTLLVFPASFSILWFFYSWKKANRTIYSVKLLEGHQKVEFTPYSFWGTQKRPFLIERSNISVVLDTPKSERAKRNMMEVRGTVQGTKLQKTTRYIIERWKGEVKDRSLFKMLFVFDDETL
jgi:hypothetical protein